MQSLVNGAGLGLHGGVHTLDNISGTGADDELIGTDGNDVINGLGGSDTLVGGGGNDRLNGGVGDDFLIGNGGADRLYGGGGDDYLKGTDGNDTLDGGDGFDRVGFYGGGVTGVHVDLRLQGTAQDTGQGLDTLVNIENLSGSEFADVLIGDDSANVLIGAGDNDSLAGGGGDDLLALAYGGDVTLNGGAGSDTVQLDSNTQNGAFTHSQLSLMIAGPQASEAGTFTLRSIENLSGSEHDVSADVFTGNNAANVLAGALGDDQLAGGGGADLLLGDGIIRFNYGEHGISGPQETLLEGVGYGADSISGGAGADTLIGGQGADQLTGGGGNDVYRYLAVADSESEGGIDLITDLGRRDVIDLQAVDADPYTAGDQAFHVVKAFHGVEGELVRSYDAGADVTHFLMDIDGDGEADMQIDASGDMHAFNSFVL